MTDGDILQGEMKLTLKTIRSIGKDALLWS